MRASCMESCGFTTRPGEATPRSRKHGAGINPVMWLAVAICLAGACAAEWPTYQHDNARSGITPENLNPPLYEQWVFVSRPPEPAWTKPVKELPRITFDEAYHVAVARGAVYFGSSADNKVYSLDASTGEIRWTTFTGGPVRLAPTVWKDRLLVGSDDGHAYCLAADDGRLLWKLGAAFSDRQVLGHGKMISLWPIRTGVLVDEGIAYFGAGIFPAEDIFICAVKVDDGTLIWKNDTVGEHGPEQEFGGVSPQGYLLASESKLYVPSGRAMPAAFDRKDGRFLYHCNPGGKVGGTWALLTDEDLVAGLDWKVSYHKDSGASMGTDRYAWFPGIGLIAAPDCSYLLTHDRVCAIDRTAYPAMIKERRANVEERDRAGSKIADLRKKLAKADKGARREIESQIHELTAQMKSLDQKRKKLEDSVLVWQTPCEEVYSMILAGKVLLLGGKNGVIALETHTGDRLWAGKVDGNAHGLAVAGERLYVSSDKGTIHCFGKEKVLAPRVVRQAVLSQPYSEDELTSLYAAAAESIVRETGIEKGYCLVLGCGTGRLAFELARRTDLKIVGIEPDAHKVGIARKRLDEAGLYGRCVTVNDGPLSRLPYSDYFANLIVSDGVLVSGKPQGSPAEMFRVLRPCGGVAYFGQPATERADISRLDLSELREWLKGSGAPEPEIIQRGGTWVKITRGPLEGAGAWTHLYADPANTACSDDELVKSPLGVLWFGDPGPEKMVDRHARSAGPVSSDGRLFVEGENVVMAYDAYNGSLLWEKEIPGAVRVRVDADGSNLAATENGLFVAVTEECLRLDAATGNTLQSYRLPPSPDGFTRRWGYLAAAGRLLYGSTAKPLKEYGSLWREIVTADGKWAALPENASAEIRGVYRDFVSRYPAPNERAYSDFQYVGAMWEPMARFPKWGDVRSSDGAVTPGMMTSDSIFAVDTETGKVNWVHEGSRIAHPTISIGDGQLFLTEAAITSAEGEAALAEKRSKLEKLNGEEAEKLKQELQYADVRIVIALDAQTGERRWEKVLDLTGCGGDRLGTAYRDGILFLFGFFSNHDRGLFRSGALKWRRVMALSAADGEVIWSKELGYLRRPVVMDGKLIVEPWMCDMRSGELLTRIHPVTGQEVTWEFIRGGHSCGITTASPHCFFLRSYSTTYYDLIQDRGMLPFGGVRGGCWLNIIMANGLVLYPEASSGCRCSFPITSTVVLAPREPSDPNSAWSLYPTKGAMTPGDGKLTPVKHLAINFGAPGDRMDEAGTLWLGYPRPKLQNLQVDWVMKIVLDEEILPGMGYFDRNLRALRTEGADRPWLFASGCRGLTACTVPLLDDDDDPAFYTVRMYFAARASDEVGQRVFDVKLQDKVVLRDFDIVRDAGAPQTAVVKEFNGVPVTDKLAIALLPEVEGATEAQAPLINAIEIIKEENR